MTRRRKFWGWGYEGEGPTAEQQEKIAALLGGRFGIEPPTVQPPPRIEEIALRPPRVAAPAALGEVCSAAPLDRAGHTYGKSFGDVVRAYGRDFSNPPDLVAYPRHEADVVALLDWAGSARIAALPYGGGSSVPWTGGYGGYQGGDQGGVYTSYQLPPGPWRQECRNAFIQGRSLLRANCLNRKGQWRDASLDLRSCSRGGYVYSDGGRLSCD